MQNTNKVQQGQNFIDMVCQLTGSFEEVIEMAILNNKSFTDKLDIGSELKTTTVRDQKMVDFLSKNKAATALKDEARTPPLELDGISYWIINKTFIVQ